MWRDDRTRPTLHPIDFERKCILPPPSVWVWLAFRGKKKKKAQMQSYTYRRSHRPASDSYRRVLSNSFFLRISC